MDWSHVLRYTGDIYDFVSCRLTSRSWYDILAGLFDDGSRFVGVTTLIQHHPEKPWNYRNIIIKSREDAGFASENLDWGWNWRQASIWCFDPEFIMAHPKLDWDWRYVSLYINLRYAEPYPDLPWDWLFISDNKSIYPDFIKKYSDRLDWAGLTTNHAVPIDFILNNPHLPWNWDGFAFRYPEYYLNVAQITNLNCTQIHNLILTHSLPLDWYLSHATSPQDWRDLTFHPEVNMEIILHFRTRNWHWENVSWRLAEQKHLKLDLPWDFSGLSSNKSIGLKYISENLHLPWEWNRMCRRVSEEEFLLYPDLPWDWLRLSLCMEIEFIISHKHLPWHWDKIRVNDKTKLHLIVANQDLPWNWSLMNTHITLMIAHEKLNWREITMRAAHLFILQHPELPWCWELIR
jgi:hypothetical protein